MLRYTTSIPTDAQRDRFCRLPLFEHFAERDVCHLLSDSKIIELDAGDILVEEGALADAAYFIVEGELEVLRRIGGQDVVIATRPAGDMIGEMSLLIGQPRTATVRSRVATKLIEISYDRLHETLLSNPEGMFLMLRTVVGRLKHTESSLVHYQKLAGLGNLAAGLAHELNNPSAAVTRSARQLQDALAAWEQRAEVLGSLPLGPDERRFLDQLREEIHAGQPRTRFTDTLARGDEEQAVHDWLATLGIGDAWELAGSLVEAGNSLDDLCAIGQGVAARHLEPVLRWLAAGETVFVILHDLRNSSRAISDIVGAVKSYTYLDQAPVQNVDLHDGIEQTLTILRHKLQGIDIVREYAENLPRITAFASELNQVWTNLIDNAADAIQGHGTISIRTALEENQIIVEISNNGPAIPPEVRQHLFEPFYTTKPLGKGTGLGLTISFNIVQKHQGTIDVTTAPGRTSFTVRLPLHGLDGEFEAESRSSSDERNKV